MQIQSLSELNIHSNTLFNIGIDSYVNNQHGQLLRFSTLFTLGKKGGYLLFLK